MTDVKFNSSSQRVSTPSLNYSGHVQQTASPGGLAGIAPGREFDFSTSSAHNIADNGAYFDLYEASYDNVSTSAILHYCKLKVLRPYVR